MDKLVNCLYRKPEALFRLICFPWAGGGSIHYAQWGKYFDNSVEEITAVWRREGTAQVSKHTTSSVKHCGGGVMAWVFMAAEDTGSLIFIDDTTADVYSLRLAGRETRSKEPFMQNVHQLIHEIANILLPSLKEKPFAFFGHSLGSYLSFATAEYLKRNHDLEPVHMFFSGAPAPHIATEFTLRKLDLPDDEFLKWMTSIGGTPSEILTNKEILQLFVPVLKADLRLGELFRSTKPQMKFFSCSISSFDGKEDTPYDLESWKDLTTGEFTSKSLPGGHFYLKEPENEKFLISYITKQLETAEYDYL